MRDTAVTQASRRMKITYDIVVTLRKCLFEWRKD